MNVFSAVVTLFLVLDPLGNIPLFLSVLKTVSPERRRKVLVREIAIAYLVLLLILFLGSYALQFLNLDPEAISIAGGIVLFLIALRMIFPGETTGALFRSKASRLWFRSRFHCSPGLLPLLPYFCCGNRRRSMPGYFCLQSRSHGR